MKNKLKNIKTWHMGLAIKITDLFSTKNKINEDFAISIIDSLKKEDREMLQSYLKNVVNYLYK